MKKGIGSIIRINRISQDRSLRGLAKEVGMQGSQLSKIERGIEYTKDTMIDSIFLALGLDPHLIETFTAQNSHFFKRGFDAILYRKDKSDVEWILKHYQELIDHNFLSCEFYVFKLAYDLLYTHDQVQIDNNLILLRQLDDALTDEVDYIFRIYYGYYYFISGKLDLALQQYELAKGCMVNRHEAGLIDYYIGIIKAKQGDLFDAYDYFVEAKKIFERYHNYIRSSICIVSIGNTYLLSGKYEDALHTYFEAKKIFELIKVDRSIEIVVYDNILLLCLFTYQYELFFEVLDQIDEDLKSLLAKRPRYHYYKIAAYFYTNQFEECKKCIAYFRTINDNELDEYLVNYFELKMNKGNQSERIKLLEKNYEAYMQMKDYNGLRYLLNLLIKEYESVKDYAKLYFYNKQLIDLTI